MLIQFETVQFFIALWLLLLMRAVNGTSGKKLILFDVFTLLGTTVYLALSHQNSIYLLVLVLAALLIRQTCNERILSLFRITAVNEIFETNDTLK